jgi:hypothetical protein
LPSQGHRHDVVYQNGIEAEEEQSRKESSEEVDRIQGVRRRWSSQEEAAQYCVSATGVLPRLSIDEDVYWLRTEWDMQAMQGQLCSWTSI